MTRYRWFGVWLLGLLTALGMPALAAMTCNACGGAITAGNFLKDTQWDVYYHTEHGQVPRCEYCSRGITPFQTRGGMRYGDGRNICSLCFATAVTTDAAAAEAMQKIRARMEEWGLKFPYGVIPVRVVGQNTLSQQYGAQGWFHSGKIQGLTTTAWVKDAQGRVVRRAVSIAMLNGLSKDAFERTAAHELMHAWMFLDQQPKHAPALEEGVCNLAAYYFLQENPRPEAVLMRKGMVQSQDPVYGEGLRRAIRYVEAHQFNGLVDMLRKHSDFPWGY
jgi:hypothetical protein